MHAVVSERSMSLALRLQAPGGHNPLVKPETMPIALRDYTIAYEGTLRME